jgi:hypothetical protein
MKKKKNIYIMLVLMLLVNAMVLIGTLGTFESNEAFSPSPEKIEKLIEKHPDRIQTDNTEELLIRNRFSGARTPARLPVRVRTQTG